MAEEPTPFWAWGWREAGWWKRGWFLYRMCKPILSLTAVVAALLLLANVIRPVSRAVNWRNGEYEKLRAIHAGFELGYVNALLGRPALIEAPGRAGHSSNYRDFLYIRRDHYVQAVVDSHDRIVLYSVTSCSPSFAPKFDAEEGVEVVLQAKPLADSVRFTTSIPEEPGSQVDDYPETGRQLRYRPGSTVSSPEFFIESWGGSNADRNRFYYVGLDTACVQRDFFDRVRLPTFAGGDDHLPPVVQRFRQTVAANTYAEAAPEAGGELDTFGRLPSIGAPIGPESYDLPPSYDGRGATRIFD